MYLRNKKTGEVVDWSFVGPTAIKEYEGKDVLLERERYESIEEFISEWEDYAPKEPLIKDEKVRKAVRAWAEACNLKHVTYKQASNEFYDANTRGAFAIRFTLMPVEVYLEDGEHYTIDELCGEEEE